MDENPFAPQSKPVRAARGWGLFAACFLAALHAFILGYIAPQFRKMFLEMNIGEFPPPTNALFLVSRYFILVAAALGLLVFASYRAKWAGWLAALTFVLFFSLGVYAVALFMPLTGGIMERIDNRR
jgi:type II secretory pathway component PulF